MKRKSRNGPDGSLKYQMDRLKTTSQEYDKSFPYFRQPKEVGVFSKDSFRKFHHDKSQLKYFKPPLNYHDTRSFDLNHGYSKMIYKDPNIKEYLNNLLRWVMLNRQIFYLNAANPKPTGCVTHDKDFNFISLNTDFFCWRGLLTRIACVPYENRDDLLVAVIKFRGSYFMCEFDTEAKKIAKETETPRQKQMSAWGLKFEQYVTSDQPGGSPDISRPVNTNEEFGSVARSRLESHSLVYGAEVDCIDPKITQGNNYVELKTSRIIEAQRQHVNFCKFKLIKWWAQSFLIGIPKVVCGFRDDNGVVQKLQDYPVLDMPAMAQTIVRDCWKPAVCFNFLDRFLHFVKANVTEDNPRCVYLFNWQPGRDVVCTCEGENPEFLFLPEWFINWEAWDKPCVT